MALVAVGEAPGVAAARVPTRAPLVTLRAFVAGGAAVGHAGHAFLPAAFELALRRPRVASPGSTATAASSIVTAEGNEHRGGQHTGNE